MYAVGIRLVIYCDQYSRSNNRINILQNTVVEEKVDSMSCTGRHVLLFKSAVVRGNTVDEIVLCAAVQ